MNALLRAWRLLTLRERRQCAGLQLLGIVMALSTVAGIAAVMPFFAVLGDPGLVERNAALNWMQSRLGVGHADFIVVLGCVFIALLVLGSLVNLAGSVAMSRFAWRVGDRLRLDLFSQYLARDYLFHARHAGATLTSRVLYQSDRVTGLLQSGFVFVSNLLMIVLIVASIALAEVSRQVGRRRPVPGKPAPRAPRYDAALRLLPEHEVRAVESVELLDY